MTGPIKKRSKTHASNSESPLKKRIERRSQDKEPNENQERKIRKTPYFKINTDISIEERNSLKPGRSTMDDKQDGHLKLKKDGNTYEFVFSTEQSY